MRLTLTDNVAFFGTLSLPNFRAVLSRCMRQAIAQRILGVATHIADSRISFDDFVKDVTSAHIGLLQGTKDLEAVRDLLIRSGHESPARRLEEVQKDLNFALETFRTLDALYHTGKLRYGPRLPKIVKQTARGMQTSQEKPTPSRSTRKIVLR